jgi:hypothetical protein
METVTTGKPLLFWWFVFLAAAFLITWSLFAGYSAGPPSPGVYEMLVVGLGKLEAGSFFMPGLILGIGASLGASSARQSIGYGLVGAMLIATAAGMFYGADAIADFKVDVMRPPQGIEGLAVPDSTFVLAIAILTLVVSSFFYAFGPLSLAMAATCVLMHLALDWLNEIPLPWQRGKDNDENWPGNDFIGGVLILAAAVWIFAWPLVEGVWYRIDPNAEARAAIASLQNYKTEPLIKSESGRKTIQNKIARLKKKVAEVELDRCASTALVRQAIESYFRSIKVIEAWQPGTELSPFSKEVVAIAEESLRRKYFDWDRLPRSSKIHLDKAKYGTIVAEKPSHCVAKET